jgi:hypothetical protein
MMGKAEATEVRWLAWAPVWLRQLGWPGLLGGALLLGSAWFITWELPHRAETLKQIESDIRRLRHGLIARTQPDPIVGSDARIDKPAQAWARLWAALPDGRDRLALQSRVLASASEVGLPLQAVQWQGEAVNWVRGERTTGGGATLWRQRMTMPVKAPYPVVRTWLDRLQREPALSIDALDIQRQEMGSDEVTAQVSLSLWWRQAGGGTP